MAPAMGQGGNDTSFGCQQHFSGFSVSINMTPKWKKSYSDKKVHNKNCNR